MTASRKVSLKPSTEENIWLAQIYLSPVRVRHGPGPVSLMVYLGVK
jgi:hypothetical protein